MPNVPDIKPKIDICREEVVNLILTSVALEEIGLAHILNAEAEKLQAIIGAKPCIDELLEANKSVERVLRAVIKKEMLLEFKIEDALEIQKDIDECHKKKCKDKDKE